MSLACRFLVRDAGVSQMDMTCEMRPFVAQDSVRIASDLPPITEIRVPCPPKKGRDGVVSNQFLIISMLPLTCFNGLINILINMIHVLQCISDSCSC